MKFCVFKDNVKLSGHASWDEAVESLSDILDVFEKDAQDGNIVLEINIAGYACYQLVALRD